MPVLSSMPTLDLFSSSGIQVMNDKGDFVFNTPQAAAIVDQFRDAYKAGGVPAEALTGDFGGNADGFKAGKVAFTTATSTFAGDLEKNSPTIRKGVIATPRIGNAPLFVQGVSVAANSTNKDAAIAFAKYLTNTANQVAFCKIAVGFMPGTVEGSADTAALSAGIKDELQLKAIGIVVESMKTPGAHPGAVDRRDEDLHGPAVGAGPEGRHRLAGGAGQDRRLRQQEQGPVTEAN